MRRARQTERTPLEIRRQTGAAATEAAIAVPSALARSQTGTVVVLDIAGMRAVNRRHGVDAGDHLLLAIEASMRMRVRDAVVTRLPGDQFIVIVPGATARERIEDDVRRAVRGASVTGSWYRVIRTTAHTGSATWHDERSRQSVIAAAESRLGRGTERRRPD